MNDPPKKTLPRLDIKAGTNHSPHVVILGAGASRICCPEGDRDGRKLPVMADLVHHIHLDELLKSYGIKVGSKNFEQLYSEISDANITPLLTELEARVREYFLKIQIPEHPTLYDYLLLTLRPKDLIVTFNWDPLLPQAFRRLRHITELPNVAFLHGNVEVGVDLKRRQKGFLPDNTLRRNVVLQPTKLLYPVEQKNYQNDPFVKGEWDLATSHLAHAYLVTVIGYSAPKTDVEARKLFLDAWNSNTTRDLAEFDIVDIKPREELEATWREFFVRNHYGIQSDFFESNWLIKYPRRTCEAFAFATLQQDPWHENPIPLGTSLPDLESWIKPLLEEEASGKLSDSRRVRPA